MTSLFPESRFARADVSQEQHSDSSIILNSPQALAPYPATVTEQLYAWAAKRPTGCFLSEATKDGTRRFVTYSQAGRACQSLATALLGRGLSPKRPLFILSGNSIHQGLLTLAAMSVGIPVVPASPAYSLLSKDHSQLKAIYDLIKPGLIYCAPRALYQSALQALSPNQQSIIDDSSFEELCQHPADFQLLKNRSEQLGPETLAKILFTSGSTGQPKGVINTHKMLSSNQQAIAQIWPFLNDKPPVIVDWLPWHHTFGGNHNFNLIVRHGGTLHIDKGKPIPGQFDPSIQLIREYQPTLYFNVPRGFAMLIPRLEEDPGLRKQFFSQLDLIFYAGAALPKHLWTALEELSCMERGHKTPMVSAWGATETAPMATAVHFEIPGAGVIGLPAPGTSIKLAPIGKKWELRVKGPNVTPGYFQRPDLTAKAFDEDGYYCTGDAGALLDPKKPEKGILFEGRIAEDFKLLSGTWVRVGALRLNLISVFAPLIQDAVVTGHDRDQLGLLVFPNVEACRQAIHDGLGMSLFELLANPQLHARFQTRLLKHNKEQTGNSTRIHRLLILSKPPSIDLGETTDKGYINQRAVLDNRAECVQTLYSEKPSELRIILENI
jgi:feruloyl-CoA synthase